MTISEYIANRISEVSYVAAQEFSHNRINFSYALNNCPALMAARINDLFVYENSWPGLTVAMVADASPRELVSLVAAQQWYLDEATSTAEYNAMTEPNQDKIWAPFGVKSVRGIKENDSEF